MAAIKWKRNYLLNHSVPISLETELRACTWVELTGLLNVCTRVILLSIHWEKESESMRLTLLESAKFVLVNVQSMLNCGYCDELSDDSIIAIYSVRQFVVAPMCSSFKRFNIVFKASLDSAGLVDLISCFLVYQYTKMSFYLTKRLMRTDRI